MPTKYSPAPPRSRQEPATDSPLAWCPPDWNRPSDVDNFDLDQNHTRIGGSFSAEGGTANATARIYSSTSSSTESLAEEEIRRKQDHNQVRRPHHSARVGPAIRKDATSRRRRRAGRVEAVSPQELESQLTAAQSQLAQKEVVTRSLQRQLDQVSLHVIVAGALFCGPSSGHAVVEGDLLGTRHTAYESICEIG